MGSVWKEKKGKWRAEVRRNHRYIGKTFLSKGHASKWVKDTELKLEKEQYENFRDSVHLSLGNLIANKIAILGLKEGWGVEYIRLTYKRWFQEGEEPAVEPNISDIFKLLNLDHEKTMNQANAEPINSMYEANTNLARQKKIFCSPTFIYEDENFWGDDRMEDSIKWAKN